MELESGGAAIENSVYPAVLNHGSLRKQSSLQAGVLGCRWQKVADFEAYMPCGMRPSRSDISVGHMGCCHSAASSLPATSASFAGDYSTSNFPGR